MINTVRVRGIDLAYEDVGPTDDDAPDAAPLVWGHGLSRSVAEDDQFPMIDWQRIRRTRRVVRFDARGHGESGPLASPVDGAWDRLALDEVGLIEALSLPEVVLGGASMGTATALHAALNLGDRVRGLVLTIPPTVWNTRSGQARLYEAMAQIVDEGGVEPLIEASAAVPPPDPFAEIDDFNQLRAASLRRADPKRLAAVFRGAAHADLPGPDAVATIAAPTLILAWSGDPGHPVSTAERLADLLPNAELSVASTLGELFAWTDRVADFLSQLA